ncbi:hypothetical protein MKW98_022676, partial [Papaver atlanticum]
ISNKCHGLPLALSLLGSLLNKKISESHWTHVLESTIWELKGFDDQNLVYPIFLLSYDGLESQLKSCFLYCALFPKAYIIRKRTYVRLWMAQGLLNSSNEAKDPELVGEEYFDKLSDRSFFQDFSMDGFGRACCKMHDLVHDFAQFLAKDHCYDSYNSEDTFCLNQTRNPIHLNLIYDDRYVGPNFFHSSIKKVDNVRTFQCSNRFRLFIVCNMRLSSDLVPHLKCLRVLKLKGMDITHISKDIDKLIHLRYLNLSRNHKLNELPDSMCGLINLQTLKLKMCYKLNKLPEMGRMIKLRNLDIRKLPGLVYLPKGIKNWRSLQTLSTSIVSSATQGCKIEELGHLNLLKDYLKIKGLGRLKFAEQAAEAKLDTKSQLTVLGLDFEGHQQSSEAEISTESVLGVLQPDSNLKKLTIWNYLGFKFPNWMLVTLEIDGSENLEVWEFGNEEVQVGEMMPRVTSIQLNGCANLIALAALYKLPALETLKIKGANQLTSISLELNCIGCNTVSSRGGKRQLNSFTSFPKLTTLDFKEANTRNQTVIMPCLRSLSIEYCPELKSLRFMAKSLPSVENSHSWNLEEVEFGEKEEEEDSSRLPFLLDLCLDTCPELILFPRNLPSLSSLLIKKCPSLISKDHRPYLPVSPNLTSLDILEYQSFAHLGDIARFKELQKLKLWANLDESFKFIPEYLQNLTKLEWLEIYNTSGMHEGGDWSILSHIPDIRINYMKIDPLTYKTSSSTQISLLH